MRVRGRKMTKSKPPLYNRVKGHGSGLKYRNLRRGEGGFPLLRYMIFVSDNFLTLGYLNMVRPPMGGHPRGVIQLLKYTKVVFWKIAHNGYLHNGNPPWRGSKGINRGSYYRKLSFDFWMSTSADQCSAIEAW